MRRISIDTLGLMSPKGGATFSPAKRRRSWYHARPRLLTTCLFFGVLWIWFNLGGHAVLLPDDSFEYLKEESLKDILNTTLGVCLCACPIRPISYCNELHPNIVFSSRRSSSSTSPSAPIAAMP